VFERYGAAARAAVVLAYEEARLASAAEVDAEHLLLGALRAQPEVLNVDEVRLRQAIGAACGVRSGESPAALGLSEAALRSAEVTAFVVATSVGASDRIGPAHLVVAVLWNDERLGQVLRSLGVDPEEARAHATAVASETSEVVERGPEVSPLRLSEVMNRGSRTMPVTEELLTFTCMTCGLVLTADKASIAAEGDGLNYSCPRDGARFATVGPQDIAFMDALITVQAAGVEVDWYDFMTATDRREP
jgi:hypothetical protein